MILCRFCLANDVTTSFVSDKLALAAILDKLGIAFNKRDLSQTKDEANLMETCETCWTKIDEFNQFYTQTERIHAAYNQQFINDAGHFMEFDCVEEYFQHVENIHNEYVKSSNEDNDDTDDKKMVMFEPFCIINVDESIPSKENERETTKRRRSAEVDTLDSDTHDNKKENCDKQDVDRIESSQEDVLGVEQMLLESDESDHIADGDDDDDVDDDSSSGESFYELKSKKSTSKSTSTTRRNTRSSRGSVTPKRESASKKKSKKQKSPTDAILDENSRRLLGYVDMKCDICIEDLYFESFTDVKMHFGSIHNQNGYIICCNRKFRRIGRLLQHCTWHDNPEAFKCDSCKKCFQDNVGLRDHITTMHIPVDERRFECEQCNRFFAKQHLLNTHLKMKHTVREERQFVCQENECGQRFVLAAYLRLHVEKVHKKADSRVCDVCARFFKCSKSYERHYQVEHTNIDQRVQCDLCQKWFKHLDTLKDHIRRHYAASETCKYCGRVSSNKKALRLHIRNVHADIDESVKTRNEFPCTVCEKIFKKKQTLREHMTLHTGEAYLYTCTFCSKTFRSSANMYAHRKRNHPLEYEEKCVLAKLQKT